jgi:hypothetical protein
MAKTSSSKILSIFGQPFKQGSHLSESMKIYGQMNIRTNEKKKTDKVNKNPENEQH